MASLYDLFQVGPDATHEELHRAFRAQARRLHPDNNVTASDEERRQRTDAMVALNDAWQILGDPKTRRRYDARRARALRASAARTRRSAERGGTPGAGQGGWTPPRGPAPNGRAAEAGTRTGTVPPRRTPPRAPAPSSAGARSATRARSAPASPPGTRRTVPEFHGAPPPGMGLRPPRADECAQCGGSPAIPVALRGRFDRPMDTLFGRTRVEEGPLCAPCGLSRFRVLSDEVLMTAGASIGILGFLLYGWFFAAARTLGNTRSWSRLRHLPAPTRDSSVNTPFLVPMDPGPSLWRRAGVGRLILALCAVGAVVVLFVAVGVWRAAS